MEGEACMRWMTDFAASHEERASALVTDLTPRQVAFTFIAFNRQISRAALENFCAHRRRLQVNDVSLFLSSAELIISALSRGDVALLAYVWQLFEELIDSDSLVLLLFFPHLLFHPYSLPFPLFLFISFHSFFAF